MLMSNVNEDDLRKLEQSQIDQPKTSQIPNNLVDPGDEELIQKALNPEQATQTQQAPQQPLMSEISPQIMGGPVDNSNYYNIEGLPSDYRLYPTGTKILGRPLKVIEVKKLTSLMEGNADFIVNDILRRTLRGIRVEDILVADKLFLILWLRANTYRESGYVVDFTCTKCEQESQYHFELDNLEVQKLSPEYDPNKTITLMSGAKVNLRFLTIGDELKINRFKEMNAKAIGEIDPELLNIANMLTNVSRPEMSMMEKYYWVTNMNPGDFSYIASYIEKFGMGIKPYVNVKCSNCGGTGPVGISFRGDFFLPSYKFE